MFTLLKQPLKDDFLLSLKSSSIIWYQKSKTIPKSPGSNSQKLVNKNDVNKNDKNEKLVNKNDDWKFPRNRGKTKVSQ